MAVTAPARRLMLVFIVAATFVASIPLSRRTVRVSPVPPLGLRRGADASPQYVGLGRDRRAQDEVPVFGDFKELAYYYADVFIGTPPQRFSVITDTGSTLTAVPCQDCSNCGSHQNPRYNPLLSSTAQSVACNSAQCPSGATCSGSSCGYTVNYAEGSSLNGVYWLDHFFLGDATAATEGAHAAFALPHFRFGCHKREGGLFTTQLADGIMGLGSGPLSVIPALVSAGKLAAPLFSLCLSFVGGEFTLGAVDPLLHDDPSPAAIQWGPMSASGFYVVRVTGFALVPSTAELGAPPSAANGFGLSAAAAVRLPSDSFNVGNTIVDSGTTFTYVPHDAFAALKSAIATYCGGNAGRCHGRTTSVSGESLCYSLSGDVAGALRTFPGAVISLAGGVSVDIPPEHLFVNMGWDGGAFCLSVYDNQRSAGVIGGSAMMGHDVIFDLTPTAPRLGWAAASCVRQSPSPTPAPRPAATSPSPLQLPTSTRSPPPSLSSSASLPPSPPPSASAPPPAPPQPSASRSPKPLPPPATISSTVTVSSSAAPPPASAVSSASSSPAPPPPLPASPSAAPATAASSGSASASASPSAGSSSAPLDDAANPSPAPPPGPAPGAQGAAAVDPAVLAGAAAAAIATLTCIAVCCCARGPCSVRCCRCTLRFEAKGGAGTVVQQPTAAAGRAGTGSRGKYAQLPVAAAMAVTEEEDEEEEEEAGAAATPLPQPTSAGGRGAKAAAAARASS